MRFHSLGFLIMAAVAAPASAQSDTAERIVAAYRQLAPVAIDAGISRGAAFGVQKQVVETLRGELGGVAGYKAGLTSQAAQDKFDAKQPILGTLFKDMILDSGAEVSLGRGVKLLIEADLMVRVRDARINEASTRDEAFAAIDRVAPFVEIPDLMVEPGQAVTGNVLTAVNGAARLGVMGEPLPADQLTMDELTAFTVTLMRDGETVAESSGRALLGDPLNVVLWLVEAAGRQGITLEAGDWLSLGSLTAPMPVEAGQSYRAVYEGLGAQRREVRAVFIP